MTGTEVADAARDARAAARRAADARKAGNALYRILNRDHPLGAAMREAYHLGWDDGYAAGLAEAELHHNRNYGVPGERFNCAGCSFATVDIGRMTEHCVATGHRQRAFGDSTDKAPNAHYGAPWERCPKRHASESQHLLDCGAAEVTRVDPVPPERMITKTETTFYGPAPDPYCGGE